MSHVHGAVKVNDHVNAAGHLLCGVARPGRSRVVDVRTLALAALAGSAAPRSPGAATGGGAGPAEGPALVGTAGTATTLAAVEQKLRAYDADRVQGFRLNRGALERQLARYLELTVAEKRGMPGVEPQRADVIAAGAAIYARLVAHLGAAELITSDRGVRWGAALELAAGPAPAPAQG